MRIMIISLKGMRRRGLGASCKEVVSVCIVYYSVAFWVMLSGGTASVCYIGRW